MQYKNKSFIFLTLSVVLFSCTQKPADIVVHTTTSPTKKDFVTNNPYKVIAKNGDTLYSIAKNNNVEIRDLIELNRLRPPYRLIQGQAVKLPKAAFHIVGESDTLYAISRSYNVDISRLAQKNHLSQPYNLTKGQKLFLPSATASENIAAANNKVAEYDFNTKESTISSSNVVTSELAPIVTTPMPFAASKTDVSTSTKSVDLTTQKNNEKAPFTYKSEKEFAPAEQVKEEKKKDLSIDFNDRKEAVVAEISTTKPTVKVENIPPAATANTNIQKAPVEQNSKSENSLKADFIWPVKGSIISGFGAKKGGLYNDGINISAKEGTPIKAADGGDVVYSGNELRGYGNMLLIKHNNGYLTAYAHTDDIIVKKGDVVQKGQLIGHIGKTGHVSSPQLHFSIRQGRKAIDPEKYLPTDFSMTDK